MFILKCIDIADTCEWKPINMHMYWSFYRIKRVFPYNFSFLVVPDSCDYWSYLRVMHFGSGPINYNHLNKPRAGIWKYIQAKYISKYDKQNQLIKMFIMWFHNLRLPYLYASKCMNRHIPSFSISTLNSSRRINYRLLYLLIYILWYGYNSSLAMFFVTYAFSEESIFIFIFRDQQSRIKWFEFKLDVFFFLLAAIKKP